MKALLFFLLPLYTLAQPPGWVENDTKSIVLHGDTTFIKNWTRSDSVPILSMAKTIVSIKDSAKYGVTLSTIATALPTGIVPFSMGGKSAASAAPATTGTMTVPMTSSIVTITPTGACTFNASGGVAGQTVTFIITTSGASSFVLTFGTNFKKTATLATGTTSARFFTVSFICLDGITWFELCRTAVQT